MNSIKFISLDISLGTYKNFLDKILYLTETKKSTYVCVANVHMLMEAYWDGDFSDVVNNADIVTPDGMPIAKGIKLIHGIHQERVAGMDLLPDLLKSAEINNVPIAVIGGTELQHEKFRTYIQEFLPRLKLTNTYSQNFNQMDLDTENKIIDELHQSGTKLILVSLGCPKQEKWMAKMQGKIHACMIGIGGALPVLVGDQKRAPLWMQNHSLEWMYRLLIEPRRLFKRYFKTNIPFLFLLFSQFLHKQKIQGSYFDISQG